MRSIDADLFCENVMSGLYIYLQADKVDIVQAINSEPTLPNEYMRGYEAAEREYKRPVGEWIPNNTSQFCNPGRHCSLCFKVVEFSENYCPECGAYMKGVTNG